MNVNPAETAGSNKQRGLCRHGGLEHDPEKWIPVFGKRSCSKKRLERDDDSKKSHHVLTAAPRDLMPRMSIASLAAGLLVAGCAADSTILQSALVMESAYEPLTCPEV